MIGVYVAGRSVLHRAPAGAKLIGLAICVIVVALLPTWWGLAIALGVALAGFALARIPVRLALRQLVPVLWILAIAAPLNALFSGWESALVMSLRVATCVALAALVTLTTRVSAMLDAVQRGLRPFGSRVDAERVGLVLALTIRAVPVMTEIVVAVLEARKARGAERSARAIAVPVVVRALQTSDAMGEALIARGFDD
jgi:biotin transport system permease protein